MSTSVGHPGFARAMGSVARELLGEPNPTLSSCQELRFGARGSMSIHLEKGTFHDHEAGHGGGVLDLVQLLLNLDKAAAIGWMRDRGYLLKNTPHTRSSRRQIATYNYVSADGKLLFQVVRFEPKSFQQRMPDGNGGWTWKTTGIQRVLYRLPDVIGAVAAGRTVYIVEGEKGVHALASIGVTATCSPGGAGKWRREYGKLLAGADVVILPDNDPQATTPAGSPRWHPDGRPVRPGQDHAAEIARHLQGVAARVRILMLPNLPLKGDAADWVEAGGTRAALEALLPSAQEMLDTNILEPRRVFDGVSETAAPQDGPLIRVRAGELHTAATAGETAILGAGLPIYQRGDTLVRPVSREVSASRGRTTVVAGLGEISVFGLIDVLCFCAKWERFDGRSEEWVRINPPKDVAQIILARCGQWRLPPIAGVVTTPTLRADGSVLAAPGYDPSTRLYHVTDPNLTLHPAVHNPTRVTAEAALDALLGLLAEFPFTGDAAQAVALSALISPVVRGAFGVAPLHLFSANTAGTGKSYLADTASSIAIGSPCPVISAAPEETETEKRLAGLLLAGYPLISIDNVNGELGGDLLCQAVERPLVRLRPLGASNITEVQSAATIFAMGNNASVRGDMVRRTIIADLDAKQERPELRVFKADPVATVLADRGRYVSACLVIVRAYILAGTPNPPAPLASFADWSTLVRGALIWLGCADPLITMEAARENDPELADLREMLTVWFNAFGTGGRTTSQIAQAIDERVPTVMGEPTDYLHPELRELLLRLFGERGGLNTRRLGKWLAAREGRIVAGRRFKKDSTKAQGGLSRWHIEVVT